MYSFVFYFIYRTQLGQKTGGPFVGRVLGGMFVFIYLLIHSLFLFSLYKYIKFTVYGAEAAFPVGNHLKERLSVLIPGMMITSIIVYRIYNEKKIKQLENRYSLRDKFYTFWRVIAFISLFFVPLFIMAYLTNHAQY